MDYRNLLVHLDESEANAGRVEAAVVLARRHQAHLTGLSLAVEPSIPGFVYQQVGAEVLEAQRQALREQAQETATRFVDHAKRQGLGAEVRVEACLEPDMRRIIDLHARYADLIVMGQADPKDPPMGGANLAEEVVISSGRPVLIVPYIGIQGSLGERVMVAWDAGRESARAVTDSLPILERAKQVIVVAVNPRGSTEGHGAEPGSDIATHLARHGCAVEVERLESHEIGVGDTLLSYLADRSVDLVVMGAYGHARLKEWVLGGVTRHILEHMTVPVIMSH